MLLLQRGWQISIAHNPPICHLYLHVGNCIPHDMIDFLTYRRIKILLFVS